MIRKRLDELNAQAQKSSGGNTGETIFWKPEPGQNLIRILPNPYNKDYPFSEFYFYYDLADKTVISPKSFGRPDPIVEFAQTLRKSRVDPKNDYKLASTIEPKARTYVAVLVRGKELEGPKLWGFGKTVYADILSAIADPDYGDITDPVSGRDVVVEFTPDQDPRQSKTKIRVKPNVSKAFESEEVLEKVKQMPNPETVWKEPSYDELKELLTAYLSKGKDTDDVNIQQGKPTVVEPPKTQSASNTEKAIDDLDEMLKDLPF